MQNVAINNNGHKTVMVADEAEILRILTLDFYGSQVKSVASEALTINR